METRICPQCGKQIPADAITCKFCGTLFFASPNELDGDVQPKSEPAVQDSAEIGGYYDDGGVFRDENGGYYDEDGNYYDESGGHFDAEGNYYDTEGGYYDKDGNYYDKDGNFFPGYYDDDGNYHEGLRPGEEAPDDDVFGIAEVKFKPVSDVPEDISDGFVFTEDGDDDSSAPDYNPVADAKYRRTMIIALSIILLLIVFLIVIVLKSRSNLSGFSKKYDVSRAYTNYTPATTTALDSDHISDSDEILSDIDEESLPDAVIPDSVPEAESSSETETTTTTETTTMPNQVIPETTTPPTTTPTTTTPTTTTPTTTEPPTDTPAPDTTPTSEDNQFSVPTSESEEEPEEPTEDSSSEEAEE